MLEQIADGEKTKSNLKSSLSYLITTVAVTTFEKIIKRTKIKIAFTK